MTFVILNCVSLCVFWFVCLCVCVFVCVFVCAFVCLCVYLFVRLFICVCVCLGVCLFECVRVVISVGEMMIPETDARSPAGAFDDSGGAIRRLIRIPIRGFGFDE